MVQVVLLPLSSTTTLVAAMAATFWGQIGLLNQLTTLSRCFVVFSPQNAVTQNNFKRLPAQQQPGVRSLCRYAREKKCNLGTYAKSTTRLRQYLGARKSIAGLPNTPYSRILICTRTNPTSFSNFNKKQPNSGLGMANNHLFELVPSSTI